MSRQKRSTSSTSTDETRYCERCGISFLWTGEEQRQAAKQGDANGAIGAPALCSGCRHLLPAGGRERGIVKWYNGRKRFGFIVRQTDGEIFVHGSELQGKRRPREGDLVEFAITETERGPAAADVTILQSAQDD